MDVIFEGAPGKTVVVRRSAVESVGGVVHQAAPADDWDLWLRIAERYPIAAEGVHYLDLAIDLDPYLFDGRATGCLTRLSAAALLNVTAGAGSVVPTFVLGA